MSTTPAFSTMSVTSPSSPYTTTPKFSGSSTSFTNIRARDASSAHSSRLADCAYSKMLSPSTTTSGAPPAKSSRHPHDLRDASRLGLHLVGEIELEDRIAAAARCESPVPEQVDHLARMALPGDEEDVADPGQLQQLERVVDHRPAPDRQQVLVRDARQLAQARRLAAGADEALRLHAGRLEAAVTGRVRSRACQARRAAVLRSCTPGTARTAAIHTYSDGAEQASDQREEPLRVEGERTAVPARGRS